MPTESPAQSRWLLIAWVLASLMAALFVFQVFYPSFALTVVLMIVAGAHFGALARWSHHTKTASLKPAERYWQREVLNCCLHSAQRGQGDSGVVTSRGSRVPP